MDKEKTPERRLFAAVINQAFRDYFIRGDRADMVDAEEFLMSPARLAFWCMPLDIDPIALSEAFVKTSFDPDRRDRFSALVKHSGRR